MKYSIFDAELNAYLDDCLVDRSQLLSFVNDVKKAYKENISKANMHRSSLLFILLVYFLFNLGELNKMNVLGITVQLNERLEPVFLVLYSYYYFTLINYLLSSSHLKRIYTTIHQRVFTTDHRKYGYDLFLFPPTNGILEKTYSSLYGKKNFLSSLILYLFQVSFALGYFFIAQDIYDGSYPSPSGRYFLYASIVISVVLFLNTMINLYHYVQIVRRRRKTS